MHLFSHAGYTAASEGLSVHLCLSMSVCLFVCLSPRSKGKRLQLMTPNWLDLHSMAGPRRALTLRSKGRSEGQTFLHRLH